MFFMVVDVLCGDARGGWKRCQRRYTPVPVGLEDKKQKNGIELTLEPGLYKRRMKRKLLIKRKIRRKLKIKRKLKIL